MNSVSADCLRQLNNASVASLVEANLTMAKQNTKLQKQLDTLTTKSVPKSVSKSGSKSTSKSASKSVSGAGYRRCRC